jgi:cyclophilin family peptidyl-prolyl cis-trans isomerase
VTSRGTITIDLLEDDAPIAVNNFIFLAKEGWFDRETFFLVIPDFYAQSGDPSETGRGNAGYFIEPENDNGLSFDQPGRVAMSHPEGEPDRISSQFFITMETLPNREEEWDGRYTIFGQVTEGLEIVRGLTARNPGDPLHFPNPPAGDRILSIRIEEH